MLGPTVVVPWSILYHQDLNPAQKRLWAILVANRPKRVRDLIDLSGHDRATVYTYLRKLETTKVLHRQKTKGNQDEFITEAPDVEAGCNVPIELLKDPRANGESLLVWAAIAKGTPNSLKALARVTSLDRRTIKKHLNDLTSDNWIQDSHVNNPHEEKRQADIAAVQKKITTWKARGLSYGQALMTAFLTQIVDDDRYKIEADEPFLVNPFGQEPLRYDLFWSQYKVAFEFHGPQHFYPTEKYPSLEEFRLRRLRDVFKLGISADQGVKLWILTCKELTLSQLTEMTSGMPKRDLNGKQHVVAYLEAEASEHERRLSQIRAVVAP